MSQLALFPSTNELKSHRVFAFKIQTQGCIFQVNAHAQIN
jgi:hypothetical protein